MGVETAIAWTDHTFNPWWGCQRVSPGCDHCYAETFAKRTGNAVWGARAPRRFFGDKHWSEPLKWDRAAAASGRPALVFCASMADVFEDRTDLDEWRTRLWTLIGETPHLIWQLLTKRPQNVRRMVPAPWCTVDPATFSYNWGAHGWPSNVWIGTTVENQRMADLRIPTLATIPAPARFLSCEPLLGPVDLRPFFPESGRRPFDWCIVGGESGPGHRPMNLRHARTIVTQCEVTGIPVFFKQVGGRTPTAGGDQLDGRTIKQFPPEAQR